MIRIIGIKKWSLYGVSVLMISVCVNVDDSAKVTIWEHLGPENLSVHMTLKEMSILARENIPKYVSLSLVVPTGVVTLIANLSTSSSGLSSKSSSMISR